MAAFISVIHGRLGATVTRLAGRDGTKVTLNGWDRGVSIRSRLGKDGDEIFEIEKTGGSNGRGQTRTIAVLSSRGIEVDT